MVEDRDLRRLYDEKILFPFIGLVKECGVGMSFGGETAMLTQPANLESKMPRCSSAQLKVLLVKYMSAVRFEFFNQIKAQRNFTLSERLMCLLRVVFDPALLVKVMQLFDITLSEADVFIEVNKAYYMSVIDS